MVGPECEGQHILGHFFLGEYMTTVYELIQFALTGAITSNNIMATEVFKAMLDNLTVEEANQPASGFGII